MPEQSKYEKIIEILPPDQLLIVRNEGARMMIDMTIKDLRPKVHYSERRITRHIFNDRAEMLDQDDSGHNFHLTDQQLKACIAAGVIAGVTSTVEWVGKALLQERQPGEN
jgi:hypothetical protein